VAEAVGGVSAGQASGASGTSMAAWWPGGRAARQPPADPSGAGSRSLRELDDPLLGDLVIGIGNPLRRDDGAGWWLARRAEPWLPAAQLRTVHQLTPELAEDLAAAARVLFIDAWVVPDGRSLEPSGEPGGHRAWAGRTACGMEFTGLNDQPGGRNAARVKSRRAAVLQGLQPAGLPEDGAGVSLGAFSHQLSPSQLLSISALLFGGRPKAWQLLVPTFCLEHGEGFSPRLRRLLPRAERLLRQWIHSRDAIPTAGRA
jgi:hydrogenase maturation protease